MAGATSFAELAGAQWLRPAVAERTTEGDFETALGDVGLSQPKIVVHSRSALITILTVANTDLLTVLPQQWLDLPLTASLIEALKLPPFRSAPICVVRRHDMPLTPIAEYLSDMMGRAGAHYAHSLEARNAGTG